MGRRRKYLLIPNNKMKPSLSDAFKKYLEDENKHKNLRYSSNEAYEDWINNLSDDDYYRYLQQRYFGYIDDEDEYDYDEYGCYYPNINHKKNKSSKHGGKINKNKKGNKEIDYNNILLEDKEIYYYYNPEDSSKRREFQDLSSFILFLNSQGIEIDDETYKELCNNDVSHCCIDPYIKEERRLLYLHVEKSYGTLRWACCEDVQ